MTWIHDLPHPRWFVPYMQSSLFLTRKPNCTSIVHQTWTRIWNLCPMTVLSLPAMDHCSFGFSQIGNYFSNLSCPPGRFNHYLAKTQTTLHPTALHITALHWTSMQFTALHCPAPSCPALHCTALHCTVLQCNARRGTALHCTAQNCTELHCTELYRIPLYYSALYCTTLYCTVANVLFSLYISHSQF